MSIQKTAESFVAGRSAKCHNARTDGKEYVLHRSPIVRRVGNSYVFNWHGYYTRTTAAHMNAVLRALNVNTRVSFARHLADDVAEFIIYQ